MRQTVKEIEVNVAYRWFLGLEMMDKGPHFSTLGKNYTRRFRDTYVDADPPSTGSGARKRKAFLA